MIETSTFVLTTEEETQAIEAARRDRRAFSALYRAYVRPVYRYLYSRVGNPADAEDLTSQVFMEAIESLSRYHHRGHFLAWLFSIARHRALNFQGRQRPIVSIEIAETQDGQGEDPLMNLVNNEEIHRLSQRIAALRSDEQDLLRLRFVAELSYREIATLLGRSEDAVKKQVYRLLARLESQMEAGDA